jgi:hypothetical protein
MYEYEAELAVAIGDNGGRAAEFGAEAGRYSRDLACKVS